MSGQVFDLNRDPVEVLTALVEHLSELAEQVHIPRGTRRWVTLRIEPPAVSLEHDAQTGEVLRVVTVAGYDLVAVPGAPEQRQELGTLIRIELCEFDPDYTRVIAGCNDDISQGVDLLLSVLRWMGDQWPEAEHAHLKFRRGRLERFEGVVAPAVAPAPPPSATPPPQPAGEVATVERADNPAVQERRAAVKELWLNGITIEDIAGQLQISVSTVKRDLKGMGLRDPKKSRK